MKSSLLRNRRSPTSSDAVRALIGAFGSSPSSRSIGPNSDRTRKSTTPAPIPSPNILTDVRTRSLKWKNQNDINIIFTYKAQSIAKMIVISFAGILTADITRSIVTRPADGIDAAPTEATVAVKLFSNSFRILFFFQNFLPNNN